MIRDLLKIEKLHAFCGKNVSIGSCAKMGSSTLGTELIYNIYWKLAIGKINQ